MKLRLKLIMLLSLSYLLIFVVLQFASNSFLLRGMEELENTEITQHTTDGLTFLSHKITEFEEDTSWLSKYSYTYQYIRSSELLSKEYIQDVFSDGALFDAEINYVFLFNLEGEVVFEKGFSLEGGAEVDVSEEMINFFEMNSILSVHQNHLSKLTGLLKTPAGLCIMSSQPVSAGKGKIIGTIINCRIVDSKMTEALTSYASTSIDYIPLLDSKDLYKYEGILNQIDEDNPILVSKYDQDSMFGFSKVNDLYGTPALLLRVETPRVLYMQGVQMVNYFVITFILIGVSIGLLALLGLNRMVMMPISKLSNDVADIDPSTFSDLSVEIPGDDEISSLSKDIDKMLETIREYQTRIKETERMVSIGATATMVGHDLRNPLQVVFMLTDLLQKKVKRLENKGSEKDIADLERLSDKIKNQASYMNKVVSDLQGFTRGVNLEIEDVDLVELVYEVLETIQIPENIESVVVFKEDFPTIYADEIKLRRVFTNLMNNAVQAMTKGGQLSIEGHRDNEMVCVNIVDTGNGIPQENLDKIFEPLFTTKAKGTGLGLTVCKRITEAHGGTIIAKSTVGVGSRFKVVLPINHNPELSSQGLDVNVEYAMPDGLILPSSL